MKLTTEQEELLVVLVAVEDYKTDKNIKAMNSSTKLEIWEWKKTDFIWMNR